MEDIRTRVTIKAINGQFDQYRLSEALMAVYKLVWDDFCSWYLEMIKPAYQQPMDKTTYERTLDFFEKLIKLLHPFIPFITEEVWHALRERKADETIMFELLPVQASANLALIEKFSVAEDVITQIRSIRKEKNIPFKDPIVLFIKKNYDEKPDTTFDCIVSKLCNLSDLVYTGDKVPDAISFIIRNTEFYIPLLEKIDKEAELAKLNEELAYTKGFLASVEKKLSNEKFVNGAPDEVVNGEKKKKQDAESRIAVIKTQIKEMTK